MKSTAGYLPVTAARSTSDIYDGYAKVRPTHPPPCAAGDLLAGREATFRKRLLPLLPGTRDARILDIGCGYGEFVYFMQRQGYTKACGIDLNLQQIETGRKLGVDHLQHADAWDYLLVAGEFDLISALDVLEHVRRDRVLDFLRLVLQALAPGGRLICQVPNLAGFHTPLFFMDFTHETAFTAPSLKQVLELACFENVKIFPMGPVAHGLLSTMRWALWKVVSATLRSIQTVEGGPRDRLCSIFTSAICASAEKVY